MAHWSECIEYGHVGTGICKRCGQHTILDVPLREMSQHEKNCQDENFTTLAVLDGHKSFDYSPYVIISRQSFGGIPLK
jgi:hypothetical protein